MRLRVDAASTVPPYEQIRAQLASGIATGALPPGALLPAIRQLAGDLGLAAGTVARAYQELERDGLVAGSGRRGTVVRGTERDIEAHRRRELSRAAQSYVEQVRALGAADDDAVSEVVAALTSHRGAGEAAGASAAG